MECADSYLCSSPPPPHTFFFFFFCFLKEKVADSSTMTNLLLPEKYYSCPQQLQGKITWASEQILSVSECMDETTA